jgi:hypothetical protein
MGCGRGSENEAFEQVIIATRHGEHGEDIEPRIYADELGSEKGDCSFFYDPRLSAFIRGDNFFAFSVPSVSPW